mmetsp:Transcript_21218/g.47294  ORF Transcript_21218/g.47294 Transcript_21218/m.47294 type:complete len:212 (-) Transcript_21218:1286-1921(-)
MQAFMSSMPLERSFSKSASNGLRPSRAQPLSSLMPSTTRFCNSLRSSSMPFDRKLRMSCCSCPWRMQVFSSSIPASSDFGVSCWPCCSSMQAFRSATLSMRSLRVARSSAMDFDTAAAAASAGPSDDSAARGAAPNNSLTSPRPLSMSLIMARVCSCWFRTNSLTLRRMSKTRIGRTFSEICRRKWVNSSSLIEPEKSVSMMWIQSSRSLS